MRMQRVPCDVGTEILNIIFIKFVFQSVNVERGVISMVISPMKGLMC